LFITKLYAFAAMEYLVTELLELAGMMAKKEKVSPASFKVYFKIVF